MKGFETKRICKSCFIPMIWFQMDVGELINGPKSLPRIPIYCVKCREVAFIFIPMKAKDLFTGWSKDFISHPKNRKPN